VTSALTLTLTLTLMQCEEIKKSDMHNEGGERMSEDEVTISRRGRRVETRAGGAASSAGRSQWGEALCINAMAAKRPFAIRKNQKKKKSNMRPSVADHQHSGGACEELPSVGILFMWEISDVRRDVLNLATSFQLDMLTN
jgi:hypothetical protein